MNDRYSSDTATWRTSLARRADKNEPRGSSTTDGHAPGATAPRGKPKYSPNSKAPALPRSTLPTKMSSSHHWEVSPNPPSLLYPANGHGNRTSLSKRFTHSPSRVS